MDPGSIPTPTEIHHNSSPNPPKVHRRSTEDPPKPQIDPISTWSDTKIDTKIDPRSSPHRIQALVAVYGGGSLQLARSTFTIAPHSISARCVRRMSGARAAAERREQAARKLRPDRIVKAERAQANNTQSQCSTSPSCDSRMLAMGVVKAAGNRAGLLTLGTGSLRLLSMLQLQEGSTTVGSLTHNWSKWRPMGRTRAKACNIRDQSCPGFDQTRGGAKRCRPEVNRIRPGLGQVKAALTGLGPSVPQESPRSRPKLEVRPGATRCKKLRCVAPLATAGAPRNVFSAH